MAERNPKTNRPSFLKRCSYYLRASRVFLNWFLAKLFARPIINGFHRLLYYAIFNDIGGSRNKSTHWLGVPILKLPFDSWVYQEIIWETKPDVIIETGTLKGGSALFFASIFDLINKGRVLTVDIKDYNPTMAHPRIHKFIGSSTDRQIVEKLKNMIKPEERVMVVLDSDHAKDHVLNELEAYAEIVTPGCYLVVEDTDINGHPVLPGWGPGPKEATEEFLAKNKNFEVDPSREKFFVSFHPSGFLRKI